MAKRSKEGLGEKNRKGGKWKVVEEKASRKKRAEQMKPHKLVITSASLVVTSASLVVTSASLLVTSASLLVTSASQ